jgi:serine/threonine-protein kinase
MDRTPPGSGGSHAPVAGDAGGSPSDEAFLELLRRRERGDAVDVERFLAEHPEPAPRLAAAARMLQELDGEPPPIDRRLAEPLQGRYRVERFLAAGGMGSVWLARDLRTDATVAVKLLDRAGEPVIRERFLREARLAGALAHRERGTARVFDLHALDDGTPYIVMEYIEGVSLSLRLTDGPLAADEARRLLLRLAHTLQAAHDAGIAHADLKPSNVVLARSDGEPVLIDFGVARARGVLQVGPETTGGAFRGTVRYAAPEALDGQINALSDQFSLGIMAFEIVTGRHPFPATGLGEAVEAVRHVEPPRADVLNRAVPPGMATAIARALAKAPGDRFVDVAAFARALGEAPAVERARGGGATAAVLLSAGALALGFLLGQTAGRRAPTTAVTPAVVTAPAPPPAPPVVTAPPVRETLLPPPSRRPSAGHHSRDRVAAPPVAVAPPPVAAATPSVDAPPLVEAAPPAPKPDRGASHGPRSQGVGF